MAKTVYNDPFFVPNPAPWRAKRLPNEAFSTLHNQKKTMLNNLGFQNGLLNNLDRVYVLNRKGQLSKVEDDHFAMQNVVGAALDGRLFILDRQSYMRQISLQDDGKGKGNFDFHISEQISEPVAPPRPSFYFFKNLLGKVFSYFNAMVEPYNNWKNFNDAITDFVDEYNKGKSSNDPHRAKLAPAKAAPLVPEQPKVDEIKVEKPEVKKPEVEKPEVQQAPVAPVRPAEELLNTNPMDMTTKEFEVYLDALDTRSMGDPKENEGNIALTVIEDPKSTAEDYYEALARQLEGEVARQIKYSLIGQEHTEKREAFLEAQKPIMASMSHGLREFVRNSPDRTNKTVVEDYFNARAAQAARESGSENLPMFTLKVNLMGDALQMKGQGLSSYLDAVKQQNELAKQQAQQSQPSQMQSNQIQNEQQVQVQAANKPASPSMAPISN